MSQFKLCPLACAMALALPPMILLSGPALAADDTVLTLTPITVIGAQSRVSQPLGAAVIDPASLAAKRSATSDTASLLSDIPGLSLYGAGGVSSLPAINGLADDRLRIKVDGMDLIASCPNHMNPALSYIDPTNVGTLKVYAGIAPVSAGGDSIGGSINAESRPPEFVAPGDKPIVKGELGTFYRSNNDARGLNLSASYATQAFNVSYSGSTAKADNYTAGGDFKSYDFSGRIGHTLARDEVGSTAYDTRNHSLGLAFMNDNHLFEAKLGIQDMPFQLYPNQRMDMLYNKQDSLNLRYLGQFDWGSLEARAYQENVDHFMDFGPDKRYWYGGSTVAGVVVGSGGAMALNGAPCSPSGTATCAAGMPMYTEGKTTGVSVKADVALNPQDLLRVGAELQQYRVNDWWPASGGGMAPGTFWNIKDGERDRTALFAELETRKSAQWMTLIGARVEQVKMDAGKAAGYNTASTAGGNQARDADAFNDQSHSSTDTNVDLSALAKYTANANYDIEFGFAHKVRSPNVYERFTWSTWQMAALMNNFVGDGNGYIGNLNLKPEAANTLSATFDWHAADSSWGFKATPFYTQVDDYIDAVQWNAATNAPATTLATDKFSVLKYMNQSARLYGVNLSGHMPLAKTAVGDFGVKALLNYTRGTNEDTGDNLYNIMPLNAKLAVTQTTGGWANSVELVMVSAKNDVSSVRNEIKTPGYGLVNLRGSFGWKTVRLDFGVENLFDKFYSLPTGGAYTGQGTTMTNPAVPNYPQWGTAVPGMGRSIYVGVNVKF
ncbi:MAG: TonB-dependent receptor plug domain-containing protein [Gammaproteobacteria bacterium]|uniref:TonB-dependent receptor plug domain-containing protein n=1 Tax=Rhodoferax sp. TaxID=50421 RepID=UPI001D245FEE|nr:TonB-dependent receptor [Rhodoferax sp.]MBU3900242.1 TonB-dependent receptor plug domain-containing protein [Gammaproteobacteria bacterium]MBU3997972.1 TonB-dependent receptor plug domain-containing protein [Gammaproteobacteria bacterium]MBU4079420.1 TonB-dependent receptor plug domain-containing protein [Gammaproteobacteria bacterium]MBU4115033.1 TonB-dependent receptor plug domain-containing protein [Gammaproteobacteria bacterium]MBU4171348.1 TonB-dependent receptor plug domain-containing